MNMENSFQPMDSHSETDEFFPVDLVNDQEPQEEPAVAEKDPYGKRELFMTGNFVGFVMLFLLFSFTFFYTIGALALVFFGVIPPQALSLDDLGLGNAAYLLFYGFMYVVMMGFPLVLLVFLPKRHFSPLSPAKAVPFTKVLLGTASGIGVCMLANVVTDYLMQFCSWIGLPMPEFPQLLEPTVTSLLLNLLVIAVLPALLEEMVFRGCVLKVLRPYGDWLAILVSAVLFGLMHGNIMQIPFALMVGIALGWLYVTTENIWIPILVHFINNALSVCLEYISFSLTENQAALLYGYSIYGLAIVGSLVLLALLLFYRKNMKTKPPVSRVPLALRVGVLAVCPALILAMVLFGAQVLLGMVIQ